MGGHIRKRTLKSGKARYDAVYTDPAGRERSETFGRKVDAERYLSTTTSQIHRGDWLDPELSKVTVAEYAPTWLAGRAKLSPLSRRQYRTAIDNWIIPRWGGYPLHAVPHEDVAAWLLGITETKSVSWAATVRQVFGQIMKAAVRAQRIRSNPVTGAELPAAPKTTRHTYLTHEQVRDLAEAAGAIVGAEAQQRVRDRVTPWRCPEAEQWARWRAEYAGPLTAAVVYVLAYCGLRWFELAGLRVGDVDELHRTFVVRRKGGAEARVPYPVLVSHRVEAAVDGRGPSGWLFRAPGGGQIKPRAFQDYVFTPACKAAKLARLTPHDLRHTCAALAVKSGANVKEVQALMGHASAMITLDVYAGLFPDDLSAVMGRLDEGARQAADRKRPTRPALGSA